MKKNVKVILSLFVLCIITLTLNIYPALAYHDYESEDDLYYVQWYNDIGIVNTVQRLEVKVGCDYSTSSLEVNYTELGYTALDGAIRPFPVYGYLDGIRWYEDGNEIYHFITFEHYPVMYDPDDLVDYGRNYTNFTMASSSSYYQKGSCHLYMPECIPMSITNNVINDIDY